MKPISLTDIAGIEVGHAQNPDAGTGCTVIICREGATAGVDVRGGGPATRETDLLRPENMIEKIHAVMLSGGSAFGLDAAAGIMAFLEENGVGFDAGVAKVPIVCGVSCFDLAVGDARIRPDKAMGYAACEQAAMTTGKEEGNIGAGCGATVGKLCGPSRSMKSGLGVCAFDFNGLQIGALTVVNAVGTIIEKDGTPIAGVVAKDGSRILSPSESLEEFMHGGAGPFAANTTISCIVTNARLTKAQATKIASMAHDAYARAIDPVHTSNDGDTVFILATGEVDAHQDIIGILGTDALESAIRRATRAAKPAFGLKAATDFS